MSSSKAVVQQSFLFILFIVVVGFIAIFGYQAINSFIGSQCEAQRITFQQDLTSYVDQYNDYGAVHEEQLTMPCSYNSICLVNTSKTNSGDANLAVPPRLDADQQNVVRTSLDTERNIFLIGDFAEPIGYSEKLTVNDEVTCFEPSNGRLNLRFRGQGSTTLVEQQ
jgi:hypothetical protein